MDLIHGSVDCIAKDNELDSYHFNCKEISSQHLFGKEIGC